MDELTAAAYMEQLAHLLVDRNDQTAPQELSWAICSLVSDVADIKHVLADRESKDESTIWRVVALTDRHIIYVEATADVGLWDNDQVSSLVKTQTSGWIRRRSDVERLEVADVTGRPSQSGDRMYLEPAGWTVQVRNEKAMTLPLFGGRPTRSQVQDKVAEVARELLRTL